ncbi:class I adenylate-forming enzyme family protein [Roseospirillum parvum]|uniref:3-methylmercaptopropionyl-CoA ligase n=1 Tax=Roseospirillum parvum TaxID=83401 RepID=A0A1G7X3J8_9PROT|nr:long-chain-fatty-acid--CoA ligase [Roseospirillum parvum]SDG78763.1 fatty-acyl-CoA synthase [Roseospirillum parvum]
MSNLSRWIERHADFTPDKPAIRFEGREITYADFDRLIKAHARALKHRFGVGRGDRVACLAYNAPEQIALLFACARLGALFLPLNWRLAAPEHAYILGDAGARVLIAEGAFQAHAESIHASLPECELVAADFVPPPGSDWHRLAEAVATARGDDSNPHVDQDCPLLLVYTSGTTGHPKGAVLTQAALQWNALNSAHMHDLTSRDHVLTVLPLFHVGGLNIQTTPALYAGATVTLHRRFEAEATARAIAEDRPSLVVLVPATIQALIERPEWADLDLSSLRCMTTGSSIVPPHLIAAVHARGLPVIQVYGATETCPIAIYQRPEDAMGSVGSTGRAALHCDIRVVDDEGNDVPDGTNGELLVRGANVMFEYWGNPKATCEALRGGWYFTGDIGRRDEAGRFWIMERKKDVIISGGENIYPAEIEVLLATMPEVADAVVVGRSDGRWGEVPVACVVLRQGHSLTAEALLARFEGRLARYKHPKDVAFFNALPRNAMGKVQRFRLRATLSEAETPAAAAS